MTDPQPVRRAELLISLGIAHAACGRRREGRDDVIRAASIARAADAAEVFADAVLALGGGPHGFEVDIFDDEQLHLLAEALATLPADDSPVRALVLARLSVASTTTNDDARRRTLAEEAVDVARRSGDVTAQVAALAAWCDAMAGPEHRTIRLERATEMLALAQTAGAPDLEMLARRFRLVALLEGGDVAAADRERRAFAAHAERLHHPGYVWYVPLWRAMRALLEGRVEDCAADNALVEELGRRTGSANAYLLAMTQRWCLLAELGDRAGLGSMVDSLLDAPLPPLSAQVTLALVTSELGRLDEARAHLDTLAPLLPSLPRDSEWLASVAQVAEAIAAVGGHPSASFVMDQLAPHADLFVVEGIGAALRGPVTRHLALLADAAGDHATARRHRSHALASARAVGATGLAARIEAEGQTDATRSNVFRPSHGLWTLRFDGVEVVIGDAKGLHDLAMLLAAPGRDIAAIDLAGTARGGDAGPLLDETARTAYRRRLQTLDADADDARDRGDASELERLEAERDAIVAELSRAFGLCGRARRAGSPGERGRTTVTARIRAAISQIGRAHPELGAHLEATIHTGSFCRYLPGTPLDWET